MKYTKADHDCFPIDPVKLEKLAEVAVKVGLQLQKDQDLVITAPLAALPLVRFLTKHAYLAGGGLVTTFYSDEETTLSRYRHASDANFDRASGWLYDGMAKAYANGAARLAIAGDNPMLLAEQDPAKVARANKANSTAYKPALEKISNFDINWNIISYQTRLGKTGLSRRDGRRSGSQARGRHLRCFAGRSRRSGRGMGGA